MQDKILEYLYEKYYHVLFLYALSITKQKEDAQDLVHETFVKAFLSLDDSQIDIKNWLYKVLKNLFIDKYRKEKRLIDEGKYEKEWIEDSYNAMKHYIKEENKKWLYIQIYQLPSKERDVLLLSVLWNMKDEEIAYHLKISIDNVRTLRYRSKLKLKKIAKREGKYNE